MDGNDAIRRISCLNFVELKKLISRKERRDAEALLYLPDLRGCKEESIIKILCQLCGLCERLH